MHYYRASLRFLLLIFFSFLMSSTSLYAASVVITDTTASIDLLSASSSTGINNGFGDVIGTGSQLFVDSSITGDLAFRLQRGSGALNDVVVIYLDSNVGGFNSTASFLDTGNLFTQAVSGKSEILDAPLTFAPGFMANYALVFNNMSGLLYELGTSHSFITLVADFLPDVEPTVFDLNLALSDIALEPGGSFNYFATLIDPSVPFRSNEFHGVTSAPHLNIGTTSFLMADGDFNTFHSIAPVPIPSATLLFGTALLGVFVWRRWDRKAI